MLDFLDKKQSGSSNKGLRLRDAFVSHDYDCVSPTGSGKDGKTCILY